MFHINYHLSLQPCQLVQIRNSYNWYTIKSKCGYIHIGYKQESLQSELKMTHLDFAILNSYVTVTYLRFIKALIFLW